MKAQKKSMLMALLGIFASFSLTISANTLVVNHQAYKWKKAIFLPINASSLTLRVVRVNNPRFPKMTDTQINALLEETKKTVKEHFKLDLKFEVKNEIKLEALFSILPKKVKRENKKRIYDFKNGTGDKEQLIQAMKEALDNSYYSKSALSEMVNFAKPYLTQNIKKENTREFSVALIETLLDRLNQWQNLKAKDGEPVIDSLPYNEWGMWAILGYGDLPYDIILTNQLIASAEYYGQAIHSAVRGGIVGGTTSYSKTNDYKAFVFATTYPFLSEHEAIATLRGNDFYSSDEAAVFAGAYLAHEIGHMLFRFGHPFGIKSCVMNPAELLKFREWYEQIDSKSCAVGSNPDMKINGIQIFYNEMWQ